MRGCAALRQGSAQVKCEIACTLTEAMDGWQVLYRAYRRAGYIRPNRYEIHTVPEAIGAHTAVIVGRQGDRTVSTISSIADSSRGLPMDAVYPDELAKLRGEGRRLIEIGLFGEHDGECGGAHPLPFTSAFKLICYALYFGLHMGLTDYVCGIAPRRVKLYKRMVGFRPIGPVKRYSIVGGNPVQLMRAEAVHLVNHGHRYRAINYFQKNPVPASAFSHRFRFRPQAVAGSWLDRFLHARRTAA